MPVGDLTTSEDRDRREQQINFVKNCTYFQFAIIQKKTYHTTFEKQLPSLSSLHGQSWKRCEKGAGSLWEMRKVRSHEPGNLHLAASHRVHQPGAV